MSFKSLRKKYIKLNNSKANVRLAMIDLLYNSCSDYTTERMDGHLYKIGIRTNEVAIYKIFLELEVEVVVIFSGYIPVYTANNKVCIGSDPVFGLCAGVNKNHN